MRHKEHTSAIPEKSGHDCNPLAWDSQSLMKESIGVWASHLKPIEGELEWKLTWRTLVAFVGRRQFAIIRRVKPGHWDVSIPGFQWPADGIASDLGIKYSTVKAFSTVTKARAAVELAYQMRQNPIGKE